MTKMLDIPLQIGESALHWSNNWYRMISRSIQITCTGVNTECADKLFQVADVGGRTDLSRDHWEIPRDQAFFWFPKGSGVSGLIPKIRFNLARTPVILYFTENKNSISKKIEQKTFGKYRDCF